MASDGSITTTVTSGDNNSDDNVGAVTVDTAGISGFYSLTCPLTGTAAEQLQCKCFLLADGTGESEETCIANGGVNVTTTSFTINLNVYEGVVQTGGLDLNGDATADLAAGSKIYAGTIWGADNGSGAACTAASGCVSAKPSVAEGLPTFSSAIDWTTVNVENAIPWTTSASLACGSGPAVTVTIPTVPSATATRTDWKTWLEAVVNAYDDPAKCVTAWPSCSAAANSRHLDKFCVSNFASSVLEQSNVLLPRIRIDWSSMCNASGCGTALSANSIIIEGVHFSPTGATEGYFPSPRNRFVIDQFQANSAGTGGSLKSESGYTETYSCNTLSGDQSCHNSADANGYLECSVAEKMNINFIPNGTAGQFNTVFESVQYLRNGEIRGGTMETGHSRDGYVQCKSKLAFGTAVPIFLARATKLN